jgi:opacity protein-like surface antigen
MSLFLSSLLYGDAKIYLGVSAGGYSEDFKEIDATSSAEYTTIKIAYGDRKAYAVEFSVDYQKNSSKIFSSDPATANDGDKIGFNLNLMKSFDFDIYILPFVRVGFGTGFLDIDRKLQDSLSYGSFQGSLGAFLPLNEHFDLEAAYELRSCTYEAIDTIDEKSSYTATINLAYIGINYRF